jgi:ABC-type branched-subunit amino acid transport system ATPase component
MPKDAALTVTDLVVRFGGVTALAGVSFTVPRGKVCGLIGPNGAGKTTLFDCVSRLTRPKSGRITGSRSSGWPAPSSTSASSRPCPYGRT